MIVSRGGVGSTMTPIAIEVIENATARVGDIDAKPGRKCCKIALLGCRERQFHREGFPGWFWRCHGIHCRLIGLADRLTGFPGGSGRRLGICCQLIGLLDRLTEHITNRLQERDGKIREHHIGQALVIDRVVFEDGPDGIRRNLDHRLPFRWACAACACICSSCCNSLATFSASGISSSLRSRAVGILLSLANARNIFWLTSRERSIRLLGSTWTVYFLIAWCGSRPSGVHFT